MYNTSQLTSEESGDIYHEDNSDDNDSNDDRKQSHPCYSCRAHALALFCVEEEVHNRYQKGA